MNSARRIARPRHTCGHFSHHGIPGRISVRVVDAFKLSSSNHRQGRVAFGAGNL